MDTDASVPAADNARRLLCVTAHPDDEAMGFGGAIASAAAVGVPVALLVATGGEHGWAGDPASRPTPSAIGAIRETELRRAADRLGIARLAFLGYEDGAVDRADPAGLIAAIAGFVRDWRPAVVLTFGPDGAYGHPDHVAVSQATTAAIVCAADGSWPDARPPHRVAKLYHRVWPAPDNHRFAAAFGPTRIDVDGVVRGDVDWPEWLPSARLDTSAHWRTVRDAVACHTSQLPAPDALDRLPDEVHRDLWGSEAYVRAFSTTVLGRAVEHDLFAGLD